MHNLLSKHWPLSRHWLNLSDPDQSDGYFLFVALISAFVLSTFAIIIGLVFALIA